MLYTDRYFSISLLESDISDRDFSTLISNDNLDIIKNKFDEWTINKSVALLFKLVNLQTKDKEEHKKLIRLLLLMMPKIDTIQYHISAKIYGLADFNEDKKISEDDRVFIRKALCENGYCDVLGQYLYEIGSHNANWDYPLSREELNEVKQYLFNDCLKKCSDDVVKIIKGFYATSDFNWENGNRKYNYLPKNIELMKEYVESDSIFQTFIQHTIIPSPGEHNKYKLNGLPIVLWKTIDNYISFIKNIKVPSELIKEYLDFVEKCQEIKGEEYISYTFKQIVFK